MPQLQVAESVVVQVFEGGWPRSSGLPELVELALARRKGVGDVFRLADRALKMTRGSIPRATGTWAIMLPFFSRMAR